MRTLHVAGIASCTLPVLEIGAGGPVVVVTGNVHGDEVTGVLAIHELAATLPGRLVHGRVVLLPTLNPAGLAQVTRAVPADGADLNRAFPGAATGSASARLAAVVWAEIVRLRPDLLLDLHADSAASIPYVIVDRAVDVPSPERGALEARTLAAAVSTGLTVVHEFPDPEYRRFGLDRSLAGAVVNRLRGPAVTVEAGCRRGVDSDAVQASVSAVLGALAWLGLVSAAPEAHPSRVPGGPWRRASALRARTAGLFVPRVSPGAQFVAGALMGEVRATSGEVRERVVASGPGMVIGWADAAWVAAGGVVGTIATPEVGS